ncbi:hypothetical protein KC19_9G033000 [Ceratodon purpureus]|uniref:Secreted protein n=1 Tax=Ceratodon purpureus TaxID=3225 RepID=A0A8T0GTR2_CERPU|nr:hypothetical protein KC19_9G033000 [Ceratodon purpureus]
MQNVVIFLFFILFLSEHMRLQHLEMIRSENSTCSNQSSIRISLMKFHLPQGASASFAMIPNRPPLAVGVTR